MKKDIIPYGKHYIDQDDIDAVVNVLKYNNLTQGPAVKSFEDKLAKYVGAKYAVAVSSWTAGLHIACLAADVSSKDKVVTSPITFVASSNAALYCGATPIFSEIDSETINMCPQKLIKTINANPEVKVIIPVHYSGLSCNMKSIRKIADTKKLIIIEDAAHALGAKYEDGSMVGSCKYSDMTGFSFHPVKSIAAGEGGMITTNNYEIYLKLLRLRSHGINKLDDKFVNNNDAFTNKLINPWYYEMQELGFNYRITDIQCALGESQLKKLDKFINRRIELAKRYDNAFHGIKKIKPIHLKYRHQSSHHLYVIRIDFTYYSISRAEFMRMLMEKRILTQVHYLPVTSHPFYQKLGYNTSNYPESNKFYSEALSIPMYYSLTNDEQDKVIKNIKSIINEANKNRIKEFNL